MSILKHKWEIAGLMLVICALVVGFELGIEFEPEYCYEWVDGILEQFYCK